MQNKIQYLWGLPMLYMTMLGERKKRLYPKPVPKPMGVVFPETKKVPPCVFFRLYVHPFMHACIHTYMCTCRHTYMQTCMHTHTHTHTHTHARTHTNTHTGRPLNNHDSKGGLRSRRPAGRRRCV